MSRRSSVLVLLYLESVTNDPFGKMVSGVVAPATCLVGTSGELDLVT